MRVCAHPYYDVRGPREKVKANHPSLNGALCLMGCRPFSGEPGDTSLLQKVLDTPHTGGVCPPWEHHVHGVFCP